MKLKLMALSVSTALLAACGSSADLTAVKAEAAKTVKRYDIVQTLAGNGEVVVAGTQTGAVLKSTDSGKTWERETLGPVSIIGMSTCPDKSFIAIDFYHKVWSVDAKGAGWKSVPLEKPRVPLTVSCDAKGRWWVAGSGAKIAVSADKGANWTVTDLQEDAQFTTLQMVTDTFGVAMGEFGMVVTTTDGGTTWKKTAKIPNDYYPYSTLFINVNEGWASGLAGQIMHTRDGGKTWSKDTNATGAALYQLFLHEGKPYGTGASGVVARYDGSQWKGMAYPDAVPVFLGAGAPVGAHAIALGGPGGLVRVVDTQKN